MASYRIKKNAQYNSNEIYFESKPAAEARAAARIYRRECDGVGIYDFRLGVVRETLGRFPDV